MTKSLYISDLDGTLLDGDARLSEATVEILNEALAAGALFTVATARTPATVDPLLKRLRPKRLPAIVMTGAAMWDFNRRRYIDPKFIGSDLTRIVDEAFAAESLTPFVYVLENDSYLHVYHSAERLTAAEEKFVDERRHLELKRFHLSTPRPDVDRSNTILYFAMGPIEKTASVAQRLRADNSVSVSDYRDTYNPGLGLVEVFGPGVSKSAAVERLRRTLGVETTIVFGDNLNDIDMMKQADIAVAVENALPDVKAVATEVIGRNTTSAVARYILGQSM